MIQILYEDSDLLVAAKPSGIESQASRSLEPDMVSEIKKYLGGCADKLSTRNSTESYGLSTKFSTPSTAEREPYVGVIHRLDKPVSGVMVYALTQEAAASLSRQVQNGQMRKRYLAVVCGKPVDNVGNYVDYLLRDGRHNFSKIVDKGAREAKRAELRYRVLDTFLPSDGSLEEVGLEASLSLLEVELLTGRHHQIRVQFAAHGTPIWGDTKYNPIWGGTLPKKDAKVEKRVSSPFTNRRQAAGRGTGELALAAASLEFVHPRSGERMTFYTKPQGEVFGKFFCQALEAAMMKGR